MLNPGITRGVHNEKSGKAQKSLNYSKIPFLLFLDSSITKGVTEGSSQEPLMETEPAIYVKGDEEAEQVPSRSKLDGRQWPSGNSI
jgi:hypothetical protein